MKYRIDTVRTAKGTERYMISVILSDTLSQPLFPGKTFKTKEAAEEAAKANIK